MSRTVSDVRRALRHAPSRAEWAVLGEVAFEAIHDLGNPLTLILGLAESLLERHTKGPISNDLRSIVSQAHRAVGIIRHALDQRQTKPVADINQALLRAARVAGFTPSQVEAHLASRLPLAAIFPDEIEGVLVNLFLNARRAMKATARQKVSLRTSRRRGNIVVSVADSGSGIPPEQLAKIFQPFYSTGRNAGSRGLGLFIARRILQRRGGTIQAASRSRGAVFSIEIPVAERGSARATGRGK